MAEEHRCQAPRLCVNNCGFFGSPATQNLCSKCYRDLQLKEQQSSNAKLVLNQTLTSTLSPSSPSSSPSPSPSPSLSSIASPPSPSITSPAAILDLPEASSNQPSAVTAGAAEETPVVRPNRCWTCRKRVGLTGFKCRCEMVFCGTHRYPEQHNCSFDFKAMGKEQIAKANPVVKAEKLEKI